MEEATTKYLNQFEFIVDYLSKDSNVLSVDTFSDSEEWLIKVLDNVLESQSDVLNVYYAPDAGGFMFVRLQSFQKVLTHASDRGIKTLKTLVVKPYGRIHIKTQQPDKQS